MDKANSGWQDDRISKGVYTLTQVGDKLDILYVDSNNKPISSTQDGGMVTLLRNHLGLWKGNHALLSATGEGNADDASAVIVKAFWEKLRSELPRLH